MIKVYGFPYSRSDRVVWMLEELEQPYTFCKVDLMSGEGRQPEHLRRNANGKVPVLDHDGFMLTESAAIVTYLGDCFPDKQLVPAAGTPDRARYNEWCYFVLTELEQPLWSMGKHTFVYPEGKRIPEMLQIVQWEFDNALKVLDCRLGDNEFAQSDRFSAVDILIAHTLNWAKAFKFETPYPNLEAYRDRISSRPARARGVERVQQG